MDPNWKPLSSNDNFRAPAPSDAVSAVASAVDVELPPYEEEGPPSCLTERDYVIRAVILAGERWLLNRAGLLIYSGNGTIVEPEVYQGSSGLP